MKSYPGPPMTLGSVAAAYVRLIVWCRKFSHQVEPDPARRIGLPRIFRRLGTARRPTYSPLSGNRKAGERSLDLLRWGLVPHWAKDLNVGFANINAKAEGGET
jgi:putative SOS response-associated peptidase YedK